MSEKSSISCDTLATALLALSDYFTCISGDIHTMHHNICGAEFDRIHKICEKYYEQLDNDYDEAAEWANCFVQNIVPHNKNTAAERIQFNSYNIDTTEQASRNAIVQKIAEDLDILLTQMVIVFNGLNINTECPISIGCANWLQDRMQYWAKQAFYFNTHRKEATG